MLSNMTEAYSSVLESDDLFKDLENGLRLAKLEAKKIDVNSARPNSDFSNNSCVRYASVFTAADTIMSIAQVVRSGSRMPGVNRQE